MLAEFDVMKSLQPHPHVVRLIGSCIEKGATFVYAYDDELFIFLCLFYF